METVNGYFPIKYWGIGANPVEMLLPVVKAMQTQINEGIASYGILRAILKVKEAFCEPASRMWHPGITVEEALWGSRHIKSGMTYQEMEEWLMEHYCHSMDLEDKDLFLIGNWCDTSIYLVSKSMNAVWRIPSMKAIGPLSSNAL